MAQQATLEVHANLTCCSVSLQIPTHTKDLRDSLERLTKPLHFEINQVQAVATGSSR